MERLNPTSGRGGKRRLRSLGMWTATSLLTAPFALVAGTSALAGDRRGRVWWRASRGWAGSFIKSAGVTDLIVRGAEAIYDEQPYILMSNHQSHLDPPSIIRSSKRPIGFLTKQELKSIPIFGWALERTGHVFVDRKNKERSHASIDAAAAKVREGRCVLVFPEGTRSKTDDLLPFKKGGFVLAVKAQAPIVPIGIAGTREILPSQSPYLVGSGPVAVTFGPRIETRGYTLERKEALMDRVREAIFQQREESRAIVASARGR